MLERNQVNILSGSSIPIDEDFMLTLTKNEHRSIDQETKATAKILNFTSEFSKVEEILEIIADLDAKVYKSLFIFVIETSNILSSDSIKKLKTLLVIFSNNRPIILQLSSKNDKKTTFWYKESNSEEFFSVNQHVKNPGDFENFPTFVCFYLSEKLDNFENLVLEKLPKVQNSSLILRFLRTLELSYEFSNNLVSICAEKGTKSDLLAAIDAYFDDENLKLSEKATYRLEGPAFYDLSVSDSSSDYQSAEDDAASNASYKSCCDFLGPTSLLLAILNFNNEVIDFLVYECAHLTQELPFEHQIQISTAAYKTNQLKLLCDLLEFLDFPFPENFNHKTVAHERLLKICNDRIALHDKILAQDSKGIDELAESIPNLKFAYSPKNNKSALGHALNAKKFQAFHLLKALRFRDKKIEYLGVEIKKQKYKKEFFKFAGIQTRENVNMSAPDKELSVLSMVKKTRIYNRRNKNRQDKEYREIIKKWYSDIYKTPFGKELLDAASQCEDLKIIFDFECDSVENIATSSTSASQGTTYLVSKWIFIGSKLSGEVSREQQIKGVIAHEICHYVMRLVYQNKESPFYKDGDEASKEFHRIIAEIKRILFPQKLAENNDERESENNESNGQDDGIQEDQLSIESSDDEVEKHQDPLDDCCNGIISSVYTLYPKEDFSAELIVRPIQIQAEFANNPEKLREIEKKFGNLFEFVKNFVISELRKFNLKQRQNVKKFNSLAGLLHLLQGSKLNILTPKNLNEIIDNQYAVITTNVPKLLILNFYKELQKINESMLDIQNIFLAPQILENIHIRNEFKKISKENSNLRIFIDCSHCHLKDFDLLNLNKTSKFFFITSNEKSAEEVTKNLEKNSLVPTKTTINYNWTDLTLESQKILLQTKINFQNSSNFSLLDLIVNEVDPQNQITTELTEIIDDQFLNLLVENLKISVNAGLKEDKEDNNFKILFQSRIIIKNFKVRKNLKMLEEPKEIRGKFNFNKKILKLGFTEDQPYTNVNDLNNEQDLAKEKSEMEYFEETEETIKISQQEMLNDVEKKKFVLISDVAGSGKSWMLKSFTKKLLENNQKYWVTCFDLKQYIHEYKNIKTEPEFSSFIAEKMLEPKRKFEAKIFKKLYKNGKICVLLDGFDEIAPDCAEFTTKLIQSFKFNGGNQLWIATRDYFEADLKKKLELDAVYKLDEFLEQHGVELIASTWVLSEINLKENLKSDVDILSTIKRHPQFEKYKKIAEDLSKKMLKSGTTSIGNPQFYKMIADVFKNDKNSAVDCTELNMYAEFVKIQYKRWSDEKGEIKKEQSVESQTKELNYHKLHELVAMSSLFPEESSFCDLYIEDLREEWTDEEIIACGLLTKKGETFVFLHETFREFFVAEFIVRTFKKHKLDEDWCKYLIRFLKIKKFENVRMFMNEAFADFLNIPKHEQKIKKCAEYFCKTVEFVKNLSYICEENHENLTNFVIEIFKKGDYKEINMILQENSDIIVSAAKHVKLFTKIQDFTINYINEDDLKIFFLKNANFSSVLSSQLDTETIKNFICKIQNKTDSKFIKEALQKKNEKGENLFSLLVRSNYIDAGKFEKIYQISETLLNKNEILELATERDKFGWNIIHQCIYLENIEKMKNVWKIFEILFTSQNASAQFRELFRQQTLELQRNVLYSAARCDKIEFHVTLWELLDKTFENRQELEDLLIQKNGFEHNYLHYLIGLSKSDIIEFTFKKFKEIFSDIQYERILTLKGEFDRNLLQIVVSGSKDVKVHQYFWQIFQDLFKSNEIFLDYLLHVDKLYSNIFHLAANFSTGEILKFMLTELERFASHDEIKKILSILGIAKMNLLQIAARRNSSSDLYQILWEIIRKYFNSSEILDMINCTNYNGNNLLQLTVYYSTKDIAELTWIEIEKNYNDDADLLNFLKNVNIDGQNILHTLIFGDDVEKLEIFWKKLETFFASQNASAQFRALFRQQTSERKRNVICSATRCEKIEYHEVLWKLLAKTFENRQELEDLLMQKNEDDNNFLHFIVIHSNPDIIEFTFNKLKEIFSGAQYKNILKSKGETDRNLLQIAACFSKFNCGVKKLQFLWKTFQVSCKSNEEFLELLMAVDRQDNNVFHLAAAISTSESLEFMINELEKIGSYNEIKKILSTLGIANNNILQNAAKRNKSLNLHQNLWKIIRKHFSSSEILDMINHSNEYGNNLLQIVVECNTKDITELTWDEIKKLIDEAELLKYLKNVNIEGQNILNALISGKNNEKLKFFWKELENFFASQNATPQFRELIRQQTSKLKRNVLYPAAMCYSNEFYETLWELLVKTFENRNELVDLLIQKDKECSSLIRCIVHFSCINRIDFTFRKYKEFFSDDQYEKILKSKGEFDRNLLQIAVCNIKDAKKLQFLWKIFQDFYRSDEEFLKFLTEVDSQDNNVFHLAVLFSVGEILKILVNDLEKIASHNEVKKVLGTLGFGSSNLLQNAARQNKSYDLHQDLWRITRKYFDPLEILDLLNHTDDCGNNLLKIVAECNTKDIVMLTWDEINNSLVFNDMELSDLWKQFSLNLKNNSNDPSCETNWNEFANKFKLKNSYMLLGKIQRKEISLKDPKILYILAPCDKIEYHKEVWDILLNNFEGKEELKKIVIQRNVNGYNFAHLLMLNKNKEIIEFSFNKLREIMSEAQYQEILKSKGLKDRNLLQIAVSATKDLKIHQFLWKIFQDVYRSDEVFLEFLKEVDSQDNNIFHLATYFSTGEIFEFMINELERITTWEQIGKILTTFGYCKGNLLQTATSINKSVEAHEKIWMIIEKYLNLQEILNTVNYCDRDGDNLFHNVVFWNTKEIVELTWNKIQHFITEKEDQIEYLKRKGHAGENLLELASKNQAKDPSVYEWIKKLLDEYCS